MTLKLAKVEDIDYCLSLDKHISRDILMEKIESGQYYLIECDDINCGVLRYGLFWDNTPFLNLIYIEESSRGKDIGSRVLLEWEDSMKKSGYNMVLTSTQSDEDAQFFYRKNGYRECGCLILDNEPLEMFFKKSLN